MLDTWERATEELKSKNLKHILGGLKTVGQFVGEAVLELGSCPGVRDTVTRFGARIAEVTNPINFLRIAGKNAVMHGFDVISKVNQAV